MKMCYIEAAVQYRVGVKQVRLIYKLNKIIFWEICLKMYPPTTTTYLKNLFSTAPAVLL